jgi:hypothetical protein
MLTDEFIDLCYMDYCEEDTDLEFHEYVDKRFKELSPPGNVKVNYFLKEKGETYYENSNEIN